MKQFKKKEHCIYKVSMYTGYKGVTIMETESIDAAKKIYRQLKIYLQDLPGTCQMSVSMAIYVYVDVDVTYSCIPGDEENEYRPEVTRSNSYLVGHATVASETKIGEKWEVI